MDTLSLTPSPSWLLLFLFCARSSFSLSPWALCLPLPWSPFSILALHELALIPGFELEPGTHTHCAVGCHKHGVDKRESIETASTTTNCSACQVVMDRRMILVLPGRRQQFICFSSREKIYYLFFIFIRKHKILLHERKKTKSQRNRNIGGGPRKETKLRKTEKGEQTKKGHARGTSKVG